MNEYYKQYLKSKWWKDFKENYFVRFGKFCSKCGRKKHISLHHRNYSRLWCEEFTDVVVLCSFCHAKRHHKLHIKRKNIGPKPVVNEPWSKSIIKAEKALARNKQIFGWN